MGRTIKSFGWAMNGLRTVWREEANFRIEIFSTIVLLGFATYFNFSAIEWTITVAIITIVLSGEVVNTVIEDLCNKIEPNQDPAIGKIKDMAAGFVLLAALGAGAMGVILILPHLLG